MSNMPGDYSSYQHNLDNDATMYDGDASTPSAGDPNVGPADMHDPSGGGPNPSVYGPTSIHDIDMGENTQEVWARANPLDNAQPGQSKRPRVLGSTRDELEKVDPLILYGTLPDIVPGASGQRGREPKNANRFEGETRCGSSIGGCTEGDRRVERQNDWY